MYTFKINSQSYCELLTDETLQHIIDLPKEKLKISTFFLNFEGC